MDPGGVFVCVLCSLRSPTLSLWMSYVRLVHSSDENVSISCPVNECDAVYTKINSVLSHIYRRHRNSIVCPSTSPVPNVLSYSVDEVITPGTSMDLSLPDAISHDVDILLQRDEHERKKKSCLFLMHLKEERMISQAAIQDVVSGCQDVLEHTVGHLKAAVSHKLSECGLDASYIDGVASVFQDGINPFAGVESQYLQEKFIAQELGCIVSFCRSNMICLFIIILFCRSRSRYKLVITLCYKTNRF